MRVFVPIESEEDLLLALSLGARVQPYRNGQPLLGDGQRPLVAPTAAPADSAIEPLKAA